MTYNEDHNDVNDYNRIDLNELYNLNRCLGGNCVTNTLSSDIPIPTLEQLVSDKTPNPERDKLLQTAQDETAFVDSSPIVGNPEQMYQPITKAESELYPTPSVVSDEIAQDNKQSENDTAEDLFIPYAVTRESLQYLNGFIRTQIGRRVTIDFLIGSDNLTSKTGYLLAVAQNYLLLNELDTNDVTACDLYTMKFIRFYY